MTQGLRYASVTFLLLAAMVALIAARIYTLEAGYEIRLRTKSMNVQDIILGEEVLFNYEIAQLNLTTLPGDNQFQAFDTVYVKLGRLPGGYWVAQSTHRVPPVVRRNEVVLKGEVTAIELLENIPPPVLITKEITVRYGIERYSVPRDFFDPLPGTINPRRAITVHAAVNERGRAAITGVRINNRLYEEPIL